MNFSTYVNNNSNNNLFPEQNNTQYNLPEASKLSSDSLPVNSFTYATEQNSEYLNRYAEIANMKNLKNKIDKYLNEYKAEKNSWTTADIKELLSSPNANAATFQQKTHAQIEKMQNILNKYVESCKKYIAKKPSKSWSKVHKDLLSFYSVNNFSPSEIFEKKNISFKNERANKQSGNKFKIYKHLPRVRVFS